MKLNMLYAIFALAATAFFLTNNANGPANVQGLDRTGSPLSPGTCATVGCHTDGAFNPSLSLKLMRENVEVSEYEPGEDYRLVATITAGTGSPARYGFQTVALTGEGNLNAGTFSVESGMQLVTLNNRRYAEHSMPRVSNVFEVEWTAPEAGTGVVRFYAACVAANNSGDNFGDGSTFLSSPFTVAEMVTGLAAAGDLSFEFSVFPNPAEDAVQVNLQSEAGGLFELHLMDMQGKFLQRVAWDVVPGDNARSLDVQTLPAGVYLMRISDGRQEASARLLKR
jgi:hypothetical protein